MAKKEPMTEAEKKTRREERIDAKFLDRVRKAGGITKTMSQNGGNNGSYFSFPDGRNAAEHIVFRLLAAGKIRPVGDGLFGDSQTYIPS